MLPHVLPMSMFCFVLFLRLKSDKRRCIWCSPVVPARMLSVAPCGSSMCLALSLLAEKINRKKENVMRENVNVIVNMFVIGV